MWNETKTAASVVDRAVGKQTGVWQESPLVGVDALLKKHQASATAAFRLTERPFLQLVNVRGDTRDAAFVQAVEQVLGCKPPETPNTIARDNGYDMLWLGPDEWLVVAEVGREAGLLGGLDAALGSTRRSVVDVSANRAVFELRGPDRLERLAIACQLDLHPRSWEPGRCAQTVFGSAPVLLHERPDATRVFVRPSFAGYVIALLDSPV